MRDAVPDDAEDLAALIVAGDSTYTAWLGADWVLPDGIEDHEPQWWRESLAIGTDPPARVAVDGDGRVVAVVRWGPARASWPDGPPIEGLAHVGWVYVEPSRWGEGIASAMLAEAEVAMRAAGFARARLNALEGGPARRFYESLGWALSGERSVFTPMDHVLLGYVKSL